MEVSTIFYSCRYCVFTWWGRVIVFGCKWDCETNTWLTWCRYSVACSSSGINFGKQKWVTSGMYGSTSTSNGLKENNTIIYLHPWELTVDWLQEILLLPFIESISVHVNKSREYYNAEKTQIFILKRNAHIRLIKLLLVKPIHLQSSFIIKHVYTVQLRYIRHDFW